MNLPYAVEALFAGVTTLAAAASSLLLAQVDVAMQPEVIESAMEVRLIMVPLIGGILTMCGMVFLNPVVETMQVKVGRACFGVFAAVVGPQIIGWAFPSFKAVGVNPFMLLTTGGISAALIFVLSKSLAHGIYNRSDRIAQQALDKAENRYLPQPPTTKLQPPP